MVFTLTLTIISIQFHGKNKSTLITYRIRSHSSNLADQSSLENSVMWQLNTKPVTQSRAQGALW